VAQPGVEPAGLLQLPGGTSGHPLSPYYSAGQEAWINGDPMPLEPDRPQDHLLLLPVNAD
jgi:penicillin amidase